MKNSRLSTEVMGQNLGKPGQKIFREHSFIQRSAKLVNPRFLDACIRSTMITSLFTRLYGHITAC